MTSPPRTFYLVLGLSLTLLIPITAQAVALIVVEDKGGISALPYYESLNPEPARQTSAPLPNVTEAQGFPVRSAKLSPGYVEGHVINAPGVQAFFLVGDDEMSRRWLLERGDRLRQIQAVGLAVNVENTARLDTIRGWAQGLAVSPVSGDDLASRLGLPHYPVLVTATAIEQ